MADFNIGDVVRLKSGGPLMTVRALATDRHASSPEAPKDHVECQWFEENKISSIVPFPVAAVVLASS